MSIECQNCCAASVGCIKCCVSGDKAMLIAEAIINLFISAGIDVAIEYDKSHIKSWLEKALISSGASAISMVAVSTILRILKYNCAEKTEIDRLQQTHPNYYYLSVLIAEILSGVVSFGVGVALDTLIELMIGHSKLTAWEKSDSFLLSMLAPVGITLTKTLSRFGIYRLTDIAINKCRDGDRNHELLPLLKTDEEQRINGYKK